MNSKVASETNGGLDYVELVAAILLGLAAVVIAWSTYQAALWGGLQDEGYTESVRRGQQCRRLAAGRRHDQSTRSEPVRRSPDLRGVQ